MGSVGKWDLSSAGDGQFRASVFYVGESYITSDTLAHEFGHNFGMSHASSLSCVPVSLTDPTDSGQWTDDGDTGDTMGSISGFQHFSSVIKALCSWFDPPQVQDVTASGEYTLDQLELPSSGVKTLRIPLGKDSSGEETYYWVEYRTPGTFDNEQGVQLRYQPTAAYDGYSIMKSSPLRFTGPAMGGGGSISGKVVRESDGSAMAQVRVYLYTGAWNWVASVVTDSKGRYSFKGLTAGNYYLRTYNSEGLIDECYNNSPSQKSASLVVVTLDQETPNMDFALAPGSLVSGIITRETDGLPIPEISLNLQDGSGNWIKSGYTDSSGRYYIAGLPPGIYYLQANSYSSAGYGFISTYYIKAKDRSSATSISVRTGEKLGNLDFSMTPGSAISGQVLRETDKTPIQNVWVYAYDAAWNYISSATTGADGRYIIRSLPAGTYFVGTNNNQGYINRYYRDVTSQTAATSIQVGKGTETAGIDFVLTPGSIISGQVLRETDKTPIQNVWVYAYDAAWNYISQATTAADGRYTIRGLPAGSYFIATGNNQGYVNKYYKDVTSRAAATSVQVAKGAATAGIDFTLAKASSEAKTLAAEIPSTASPPVALSAPEVNPKIQLSDVTSTAPFIDPYRGVKIELLETTGSGAAARAKVKISLSKLRMDAAHSLNFSQLPIGGMQAKELTISNQNATAVTIGTPGIQGRNAGNFTISKNGCSGSSLAPAASCKIEVTFSPASYSGNTAGEFAVLRIPTTDSLLSSASVDLWGKVLAADLEIRQYLDPTTYLVGQNRVIHISGANRGTVSFSGVVTVTDALPAGLRFISGSSGWNCSVTGRDARCSRSLNLAPGNGYSLDLTVAVMPEAAPFCVNRVIVSGPSDANPDNDTAVLSIAIGSGPGVLYGPQLLKTDGTFTGIALYNAGTATAALSVTALDKAGAALKSSGMTNPASLVLKPGEQFPIMDDPLWGFPSGVKEKMSWFKVESLLQRVFGFALAFDSTLQVLDGATLSRSPAGTAIFPDIVIKDFTRIHVVNPDATDIDLTIELVSMDGNTRATATRKLAPNASLTETVPELFGSTGAAESDYVRIASNGNFMAVECMGANGRWIRALGAQDAGGGAQVLYSSQYVTGGPDWSTSISIVNLDSTSAQIRARLINNEGTPIGETVLVPIKAKGKVILSGQSLFMDAGSALTQGYVEVTSDGARLAGSVTFGDKQGTISATLPLQAAASRELVFGHAASNSTWYTGIAVVNPNASDVTATFQLFDKTGQLMEAKTEVIKARQRKIQLLSQFFPKIADADIVSGYIRVSADNPITGFALFGTNPNKGSVLSAIPPHAIR